jgi:hypothetical protein
MSSKELLIKELEDLGPLEILQVRTYLHKLKSYTQKSPPQTTHIDMAALRKSLSQIKGTMSEFISNEREDRI